MQGGWVGSAQSVVRRAWLPSDEPNLEQWVSADSGLYQDSARTTAAVADADPIGGWADRSGHARHFSQATSGKRAALVASSLNGRIGVRFNGSTSILKSTSFSLSQPVTIYAAVTLRSSGGSGNRLCDGNTQNQFVIDWILVPNRNRLYDGTASVPSVRAAINNEPDIIVATFNGASSTLRVGNGPESTANPGSGGLTAGNCLGANGGESAGFYAAMDLYEYMVYSGVHTAQAQSQVRSYLRRWMTPSRLIVCDGDSLTSGQGSTAGHDYPTVLGTLLGGTVDVHNFGVTSQVIPDCATDAGTQVYPYGPALHVTDPVLCFWCGTNDLYYGPGVFSPWTGEGANAADTYTRYVNYCLAAKAAGFRVVAFTILPRTSPGVPAGFEADRQTVSANIRANYLTFADALCDVAADPNIGAPGASNNTTYYNADKLHLNDTGYAYVAALAAVAVQSLPS